MQIASVVAAGPKNTDGKGVHVPYAERPGTWITISIAAFAADAAEIGMIGAAASVLNVGICAMRTTIGMGVSARCVAKRAMRNTLGMERSAALAGHGGRCEPQHNPLARQRADISSKTTCNLGRAGNGAAVTDFRKNSPPPWE